MWSNQKILVVGTTPDYVDIIRGFSGGRAVFITEPELRTRASEPAPEDWEELLSEFHDPGLIFSRLETHLKKYSFSVSGIVSFDCESLAAASFLAEKLKLPFPSGKAVENCRDKFVSKKLWKASGIKTPESEIINSAGEALRFFRKINNRCVFKPRTGTGSELVFLCSDETDIEAAYNMIEEGLENRKKSRLYNMKASGQIIAEEFINAPEYSADFTINDGRIKIIRITQKIKHASPGFGITTAYLLLNAPPPGINTLQLQQAFLKSCRALSINNAICMMDFFVKNGDIFLLETAPRPGGDCIPFLLEKAAGLNILEMTMDFSLNPEIPFGNFCEMEPHLGIRIITDKTGILKEIDISKLAGEKEIKDIQINMKTGSEILMPPANYDSWILGHIIAERKETIFPEQQVKEILEKVYCKIVNK